MRTKRGDFALALAAALGLAGSALPAAGDPAGAALAPPGACAEPHADVRAAPDADVLAPEKDAASAGAAGADDFELAGSPRHHFTPHDVAAGGDAAGGAQPPEPLAFIRDACDAPDAGCGALVQGAPRGLVESGAQTGFPPGAGTQGGAK
jgi:hypothetical protein